MRGVADVSADPAQTFVEFAPNAYAPDDEALANDPELVRPHETIGNVPPLGAIVHQVRVSVGIGMRDLLTSDIPFVLAKLHKRIAHFDEGRDELIGGSRERQAVNRLTLSASLHYGDPLNGGPLTFSVCA
jgi:hypothetical protein